MSHFGIRITLPVIWIPKSVLASEMTTNSPHDETIANIGTALDQYIFAGLYKRSANKLEFSLSSLVHMAKVTKKLGPLKVYSFAFGICCVLAFLRVFNSNKVKGIVYALVAFDAFRISYNSYERTYASIAGKLIYERINDNSLTVDIFLTVGCCCCRPFAFVYVVCGDWPVRRTLSSTKELGSVVMSFFTCGKKSENADHDQNDVLKSLAEDVKWKFLLEGTVTEMAYKKVNLNSM